jgi:hypothetical protein
MTSVLDSQWTYGVGLNEMDSPGVGLFSGDTVVTLSESFNMWFGFKPSDGHWVPLRIVNWSWSGTAMVSGANWVLTSESNTLNPQDADTETYPYWTNNSSNITTWTTE